MEAPGPAAAGPEPPESRAEAPDGAPQPPAYRLQDFDTLATVGECGALGPAAHKGLRPARHACALGPPAAPRPGGRPRPCLSTCGRPAPRPGRLRTHPSLRPGVASQSALVPGPPDVASQWGGTSRAPRPSSAGTQTGTPCAPADLTAASLPLCPAVRRGSDPLGPQQDRCRWWSLWGAGGDGLADRLDIAAHGAPCCSCCVSQTRRSCVRRLFPFVLYL